MHIGSDVGATNSCRHSFAITQSSHMHRGAAADVSFTITQSSHMHRGAAADVSFTTITQSSHVHHAAPRSTRSTLTKPVLTTVFPQAMAERSRCICVSRRTSMGLGSKVQLVHLRTALSQEWRHCIHHHCMLPAPCHGKHGGPWRLGTYSCSSSSSCW